jgi:phage terminase large subunit
MSGEAGDGIGRGDRASLYFLDEAAFLERSELIDASLSHTTRCRIDISTPNGMANSFAQRRHSGKFKVFTFSWMDDPRKSKAWYDKMCGELDDVTLAQEVDISYLASVRGIVIPQLWVQAAIGAHLKLGIEVTGYHYCALDIADEGADLCSFAGRHGILLQHMESWSGKGSDTYRSVVRAMNLCERHGYKTLTYDADGMGALVKGDVRAINEARRDAGKELIHDKAFRGSAAPINPESEMIPKRKNKDYFANMKAMSWWALRLRFRNTYRWVVEKLPCDPDEIISIDPNLPELTLLAMELSQATWTENNVGKIVIDKAPDGSKSPNRADAAMIAFNPSSRMAEMWVKLGKM